MFNHTHHGFVLCKKKGGDNFQSTLAPKRKSEFILTAAGFRALSWLRQPSSSPISHLYCPVFVFVFHIFTVLSLCHFKPYTPPSISPSLQLSLFWGDHVVLMGEGRGLCLLDKRAFSDSKLIMVNFDGQW